MLGSALVQNEIWTNTGPIRRHGLSTISRVLLRRRRHWALGLLIAIYLGGVFMLAVTLHSGMEPVQTQSESQLQFLPKFEPKSQPHPQPQVSSREDRILVHEEQNKSNAFESNGWCQPLRYRPNTRKWPVTALISFPGSGNTWLRYLLQQATGFYTGSVCEDIQLQRTGFPAEMVMNESVLVVKTHEWAEIGRKPFDRAVLIVRSPAPAIVAEFHRLASQKGHVGVAPVDKFTEDNGKVWKKNVRRQIINWHNLNLDWLNNFHGPLHVVLYEDLLTNLEPTLRRLLDFLEIPISDDIMKCVLERREGLYHREPVDLPNDLFTDEMKQWIETRELVVYDRIRQIRNDL